MTPPIGDNVVGSPNGYGGAGAGGGGGGDGGGDIGEPGTLGDIQPVNYNPTAGSSGRYADAQHTHKGLALCETIEDLRALPVPNDADASIHVAGYYATADGGGGRFDWNADSEDDDNGGAIIKPDEVLSDNPGRWIRPHVTVLNVLEWGAVAVQGGDITDLTEDSYASIQAILDYIDSAIGLNGFPSSFSVYFPTGNYRCSQTINLNRPVNVYGDGRNNTYIYFNNRDPFVYPWTGTPICGFKVNCAQDIEPTPPAFYDAAFVRIRHLSIVGDGNAYTFYYPTSPLPIWNEYDPHITDGSAAKSFDGTGITILTHGVVVEDVSVAGFARDGINIGSAPDKNSNGWNLKDIYIYSCGRHGVYVCGDNANAGNAEGLDIHSCGLWGVFDRSFLGNNYIGCESATCGTFISDIKAILLEGSSYKNGLDYSILVGAQDGGTWWTNDYGLNNTGSWISYSIGLQYYNDATPEKRLRTCCINALAKDDDRFYAGSGSLIDGYDGAGVFTRGLSFDSVWAQNSVGLTDTDIRSLAAGNGKVIAGTGSTGCFKSNEGTTLSWSAVTGLTSGEVAALVYDSVTDNGTFYAGVNGSGVYKSTNSGTSWAAVNTGLTTTTVLSLAIDADGKLYAGCANGKIFESTDAGANWSEIFEQEDGFAINAIAADPNNTNLVYAGTEGGGIYVSDFGGENFAASNAGLAAPQSDAPIVNVNALVVADDGIVYACVDSVHSPVDAYNNGGVFSSEDSGENWLSVGSANNSGLKAGGGFTAIGSLAPCSFVGCYSEGDQKNLILPPSVVYSGILAVESPGFPGYSPNVIGGINGIEGLQIRAPVYESVRTYEQNQVNADLNDSFLAVTVPVSHNSLVLIPKPTAREGKRFTVMKVNNSDYQLEIQALDATINDSTQHPVLNAQWDFITLEAISDDEWVIIGARGLEEGSLNEYLLPYVTPTAFYGFYPVRAGNYIVSVYYRVITGTTDVTLTLGWTDAGGAQSLTLVNGDTKTVGSYQLAPLVVNSVADGISGITLTGNLANANRARVSIAVRKA